MSKAQSGPRSFETRTERLRPRDEVRIEVAAEIEKGGLLRGRLADISQSGLRCLVLEPDYVPTVNAGVTTLQLVVVGMAMEGGAATVRRVERLRVDGAPTGVTVVALAFAAPRPDLLEALGDLLQHSLFVTDELRADYLGELTARLSAEEHTLLDFYRVDSPDLFAKCGEFYEYVKAVQSKRIYQALYRVTLTSGLDHRITVFNPILRVEQQMICFDSNSYLGLHLHPRVISAVKRALDQVGYGTPSAQLLCGTSRYLRELEETISRFHGREDTIVFPSGYSANLGAITALVREVDLVVHDRFSHASIHAGCRATGSRFQHVFPHQNLDALERLLVVAEATGGHQGKLIVTDGVFSMHGRVAKLPELVEIARRHGAKLMVDEAHSTGVIGPTGRGLEDLYGLPGTIDVLMGTFSKAPGTTGGYVCGSRELIYYLRFFAGPAMFTASLPAALCAGVTEAFRIMEEEPEHRERLWANVRAFVPALRDAGFIVPEMESAIVTVFMGSNKLMWLFSRALFDACIKAGNVAFPAVPMGEAIVRLALSSRHTEEDLARTVEVFTTLGRTFGMLHKSEEEIRELGERLSLDAEPQT
jgi:glycine C-acetyltransferase